MSEHYTKQEIFPWGQLASPEDAVTGLRNMTDKINVGRRIAAELCATNGTVASFEVLRIMRQQGLVPESEHCYWTNRIFYHPMFENTGKSQSYRDKTRNTHTTWVRTWKLRNEAKQ